MGLQDHIDLMRALAGETDTVRTKILQHLAASMSEERQAISDYGRRLHYAGKFPALAKLYDHLIEEETQHLAELTDIYNALREPSKQVVQYRGYTLFWHEYSPWEKKWDIFDYRRGGKKFIGTAPTLEEAKKRVDGALATERRDRRDYPWRYR